MSSVWLCIPSARPPEDAEKVLSKWRAQGYKIALWRDEGPEMFGIKTDGLLYGKYPGYARAVNELVDFVARNNPDAEWFVTGGDDVEPDMNHTAEEIARQCSTHFAEKAAAQRGDWCAADYRAAATFGVMQPTGDRFAGGSIDRICGSPWMGREFCRRIYGGKGPLWPEFFHMFVDEHLQRAAQKLGILWQRPDLIHLHRHFMRASDDLNSHAVRVQPPSHLVHVNLQKHWDESKAIFQRLEAAGFAEAGDLLQ